MHHTVAWFEDITNDVESDVQPIVDQMVAIQNAHFMFEEDHALLYARVGSPTLVRARWQTPKLRQISLPFIRPIEGEILPEPVQRIADYRKRPLIFRQREEIALLAFPDGAAAENFFGVAGFQFGPMVPAPMGDVLKFRMTSTTAATAEVWSDLVMVLPDILPYGIYAVIGLEHFSANAICCRLIFENQWPRPGSVSVNDLTDLQHEMFTDGGLGVYGQFHSTRIPGVQVVCDGADAVHEVYLDLVRIG